MTEWAWMRVPQEDDAECYYILKDGNAFGSSPMICTLSEINHLVDALSFYERTKEKGFFDACAGQEFDIIFEEAPKKRAPRRRNVK